MARRKGRRTRSAGTRSERRRRALNQAAAEKAAATAPPPPVAPTEPVPVVTPAAPAPAPTVTPEAEPRRDDRRRGMVPLIVAAVGGLLVLAVLLGTQVLVRPDGTAIVVPSPSVVVGELGGEIVTPEPTASPSPTEEPTPPPTPAPTPVPTPVPTAVPTTLAAATPAPTAAATAAPATPPPAVPAASPTPIVVAVLEGPDDAVAVFYAHAVDEEFDAAYALWSDRMKAQYPREDNLDGRFDQTAAITFTQLQTVERSSDRAVVQANFVEEYDSGGSREFIGFWELVFVDGRWLLDQPHY